MAPIDYSKYSTLDLLDAQRNIDREKYPENYRSLISELDKRPDKDIESKMAKAGDEKAKQELLMRYSLRSWERWIPLALFISWILFGISKNDVYIPGHYGVNGAHRTNIGGIFFILGLMTTVLAGLFRRLTLNKFEEYRGYYWMIISAGMVVMLFAAIIGQKTA